jgi:hypothetical protein
MRASPNAPRAARYPPDLYQKGNPVDDKSVTPDPWAAIAAELRRIADDVETLVGSPAPGLFSIDVQPFGEVSHPPVPEQLGDTTQAVDDVANALLGKSADTKKMSDGKSVHCTASGRRGRILLSVYQAVADTEDGPEAGR